MGVAGNGPHPLSDIVPRAPMDNSFRNHLWFHVSTHQFPSYVIIVLTQQALLFAVSCACHKIPTLYCVVQSSVEVAKEVDFSESREF